jgi:hypothetical protein
MFKNDSIYTLCIATIPRNPSFLASRKLQILKGLRAQRLKFSYTQETCGKTNQVKGMFLKFKSQLHKQIQ